MECYMFFLPTDVQSENNSNATSLKALASKVLFALSQNHFGAVFNRISARLQELSACSEENPDYSDIELIQVKMKILFTKHELITHS